MHMACTMLANRWTQDKSYVTVMISLNNIITLTLKLYLRLGGSNSSSLSPLGFCCSLRILIRSFTEKNTRKLSFKFCHTLVLVFAFKKSLFQFFNVLFRFQKLKFNFQAKGAVDMRSAAALEALWPECRRLALRCSDKFNSMPFFTVQSYCFVWPWCILTHLTRSFFHKWRQTSL